MESSAGALSDERRWHKTRTDAALRLCMDDVALHDVPTASAGPLESAQDKQEWRAAMRLISKLPERQQAVLAYSVDGATTREIAHRLGITEATVRSTLRHARTRLARMLDCPAADNW
ncbi:RNA polymerase sigma factor [Streptomyces sp. NPDC055287]